MKSNIEKIEQKKQKIKLEESRVKAKKMRINEEERKVKDRIKYNLGGLVIKAGIERLNNNELLGAFLEIKERIKDGSSLKKWRDKGATAFEKDKAENGEYLIISFESEPPKEAKDIIKKYKIKWNQYRKEWQGRAKKDLLENELKEFGATIESVE
jgi:hypothetical protein